MTDSPPTKKIPKATIKLVSSTSAMGKKSPPVKRESENDKRKSIELSAEDKMELQRQKVLEEIVSTEQVYLDDLQLVKDVC